MLNYQLNLDLNFTKYLITGNNIMINKFQNFILTPIKVSYKDRSDYTPIENFVLNPVVLALIVFLITFQAFTLNNNDVPQKSDNDLSNAIYYLNLGDFENSSLLLNNVLDKYPSSKSSVKAKFYLGRIAYINGNNEDAIDYLKDSVSKLNLNVLKKEGFIMLADLENDIRMFDKAIKNTDSKNEIKYITILKAKKLAFNGNIDQASFLLETVDTKNPAYKELYEEVSGYILSFN